MPQVFRRSLVGPPQPNGDSESEVYAALMQELLKNQQFTPKPMYTPEQARSRIDQNNNITQLGLLGTVAGDDSLRGVGGQILKQALADRAPIRTQRGTMDPLSGEEAVSPEWQEQQRDQRQGKILQLALADEQRRAAIQQRREAEQQRAEDRQRDRDLKEELVRTRVSTKSGPDPEMADLKKQLVQSQIDANKNRVNLANDKLVQTEDKRKLAAERSAQNASRVSQVVDDAIKQSGFWTTGLVGSGLRRVPGSPAYDLEKTVNTIKANLGFDQLSQMRQASPTGGALGNVSNKEIDFLQSVVANLDPNQSRPQLLKNLNAVKTHLSNWQKVQSQIAVDTKNNAPAANGGWEYHGSE